MTVFMTALLLGIYLLSVTLALLTGRAEQAGAAVLTGAVWLAVKMRRQRA